MKFQPMGDRVTVKLIPKPKKKSKIIRLNEDGKEITAELGPFKGEVLAIGGGTEGSPMRVKVGDIVFFDDGREFNHGEAKFNDDWDVFKDIVLIQNSRILGWEI